MQNSTHLNPVLSAASGNAAVRFFGRFCRQGLSVDSHTFLNYDFSLELRKIHLFIRMWNSQRRGEAWSLSSANSSSKQPQVQGNSMQICDLIKRDVKWFSACWLKSITVNGLLWSHTRLSPLIPLCPQCRQGTEWLLCKGLHSAHQIDAVIVLYWAAFP